MARHSKHRTLTWTLALVLSAAAAQAETGKLLLTGGVGSIDGAAGGGLTPWALTGSYATNAQLGGTNGIGLEKIRLPVTVNVTTAIAATPEAVTIVDLKEGSERETKLMLQGNSTFKILAVNGGDAEVGVKAQSVLSQASHTLLFTVKPSKVGDLKRSIEVLTDHKDMPKLTIPFEAKVSK